MDMLECTNWTMSGRMGEVKTEGRGVSVVLVPERENTEMRGRAVIFVGVSL